MIPSVSLLPVLLLLSQFISAAPHDTDKLLRRADDASTTPTPTAWLSVGDNGSVSTVTPSVGTDSSGNPTQTVNAKPSETASSEDEDDNTVARCDSSRYELGKTGNVQPWIPFCAPHNGTEWWVGGNYYVTWNPTHWPRNSTVKIMLNYVNPGGRGKAAGSWEGIANSYGLINVKPSKDWLENQTALEDGDNSTVENQAMYFLIADDSPSGTQPNFETGPTIILTSSPSAPPVDKSPSNRPPVSFLGLAVGLPLVFVFVIGTILSLHFCMKSKRTVGPISIGGGRRHFSKRGYSGRAVRRQKTAVAAGSGDYRDEPEGEITPAGGPPKKGEWELTSVQGGR